MARFQIQLQRCLALVSIIVAYCFQHSLAAVSTVTTTQVVKVTGGLLSYFKVIAPPGEVLRISAVSARPVALMAASGYLPTESRFEVSNFQQWMTGARKTQIRLPVDALKTSACDPPGILTGCFDMMPGQGLRCGQVVSRPRGSQGMSLNQASSGGFSDPCQKYVGTCRNGACEEGQGPTVCNITDAGGNSGNCVCQRGFCEISGKCINAELVHTGCYKITGETCPNYTCDPASGPANCVDGICVCKPGFCSVGGICLPGAGCQEFAPKQECEASPDLSVSGRRLADDRRTTALGLGPGDCCRVIDTSRAERPSRFTRCAARHFYSIESAAQKGIHPKLLAEFQPGGVELVIAVRGGSAPEGETSEVQVDLAVEMLQHTEDVTVAPLNEFRTIQELVAPPLPNSVVELGLLDAPLVGTDQHPMKLPLLLKRGEPTFIKLGDASHAAARHGVLQLHIEGLPDGSNVLYSRSWPDPMSLMDFGHAIVADELDVGNKGSVWQAASLNTRFFAVIPSRAAKAVAFFKVAPPGGGPLYPGGLRGNPEDESEETESWFQGSFAATVAAVVLGSVGIILWKWHAGHFSWTGEVPHEYINIHGSIREPPLENATDEEAQSAPAQQFLTALRCMRDEIKEKADNWTSRLSSLSTRAGTTRRSADSDDDDIEDYHSDEKEELMKPIREDEGTSQLDDQSNEDESRSPTRTIPRNDPARIDSGDDNDQEALDALLKLRPAAQDSIGDDDDEDEASCPLMGSARLSALSR